MFKKSSKVKGILSRQSVAVFVITIAFLLFITSCAAGPNTMEDSQSQKGKVASFKVGK